jgi:hypothetical protein
MVVLVHTGQMSNECRAVHNRPYRLILNVHQSHIKSRTNSVMLYAIFGVRFLMMLKLSISSIRTAVVSTEVEHAVRFSHIMHTYKLTSRIVIIYVKKSSSISWN